jgi:hypothetical protein
MEHKYIQNGLVSLGMFIAIAMGVNWIGVLILGAFCWNND